MRFRWQEALNEFVKKAMQAYGGRIQSIIMFGLFAQGTAMPDSDIDLLILIDKEDFRLRRELIGMTFDILMEAEVDISAKVISREDFEARKSFSFLQNALIEGIRIL
jgi:predicted nucleotidyltransferase